MKAISLKFKQDLFIILTESIKKRLETKGVKEKDILEDFEKFRKTLHKR